MQFAQAKEQTQNCKRASTSPPQKRISFFSNVRKTHHTADTTMTQKHNTDNGLQGRWTRTTGYNSTYPKVAVQWLNQALYFYQSLCLVDSEVLRNRHLRVAANRFRLCLRRHYNTKRTQKMNRRANASAKSKELQPMAQAVTVVAHSLLLLRTKFILNNKENGTTRLIWQ